MNRWRRWRPALATLLAACLTLLMVWAVSTLLPSQTTSPSPSPSAAASLEQAATATPTHAAAPAPSRTPPSVPGVPATVWPVLAHVDATDGAQPLPGYEGGRRFGNYEGLLPDRDAAGRRVTYQEWDVNPLRAGRSRGAERLVTGSDGSAYYTRDHYDSFVTVRTPRAR